MCPIISCSVKELLVLKKLCRTLCNSDFALWLLSWVNPLKRLSSNLMLRNSCHNFALEWLLFRVGSLTFLKVTSSWETLVTNWTCKSLLFCVGPLSCSFKDLDLEKHLSHFAHLNLSWVDPLMGFQVTWCWEALVTLSALEWLLPWWFPHVPSSGQLLRSSWHTLSN